jgi:excisionase family DNA binding protein
MITVAEAARRLHLSQEQVRRNLRDGKLRGQRVGNQWFVDERAVGTGGFRPKIAPALRERILKRRAALAKRGVLPDIVQMLRDSRDSH